MHLDVPAPRTRRVAGGCGWGRPGARPRTDWLPPDIAADAKGFILTGAEAARSDRWPRTVRDPCAVETTCPCVFAAGDVRSDTTRLVAFAVGDTTLAVTCGHRVLVEL